MKIERSGAWLLFMDANGKNQNDNIHEKFYIKKMEVEIYDFLAIMDTHKNDQVFKSPVLMKRTEPNLEFGSNFY